MDLIDFTVGEHVDPDVWATWTVLATATAETSEYRVCTADDSSYHVVWCPHGPHEVIVAVSEHGDYVSALRGVAAYIEEQEVAAGRHAAAPFDIRPRLRIRRTWDCTVGEHAGLVGVGLDPLFVTAEELRQLQTAYGHEEDA